MDGQIKHNYSDIYCDAEIADLIAFHESGLSWEQIAKKLNKKYFKANTPNAWRKTFTRYKDIFNLTESEGKVKLLQQNARTKRNSSQVAKENRALVEYFNDKEDFISGVKEVVEDLKKFKITPKKKVQNKSKNNMTLELMLTDLHIGKKTETFNLEVATRRIRQVTHAVLEEIKRYSEFYNVHRIIIYLGGDFINSDTMHGPESARECEFGNSEQVRQAIKLVYEEVIVPLATTGLDIDLPCVTGNHDRSERARTSHLPGNSNWSWSIYKTLELLCKHTGLTNVTFHIPEKCYILLPIYKNTCLYEHGDNVKSTNKKVLEGKLADRQTQEKTIIDFMRIGHWHEYLVYGRGRVICNESLPGQDSYSNTKGYDSHAGQTLNFYIETDKRPTCFYKSFPIYIE